MPCDSGMPNYLTLILLAFKHIYILWLRSVLTCTTRCPKIFCTLICLAGWYHVIQWLKICASTITCSKHGKKPLQLLKICTAIQVVLNSIFLKASKINFLLKLPKIYPNQKYIISGTLKSNFSIFLFLIFERKNNFSRNFFHTTKAQTITSCLDFGSTEFGVYTRKETMGTFIRIKVSYLMTKLNDSFFFFQIDDQIERFFFFSFQIEQPIFLKGFDGDFLRSYKSLHLNPYQIWLFQTTLLQVELLENIRKNRIKYNIGFQNWSISTPKYYPSLCPL